MPEKTSRGRRKAAPSHLQNSQTWHRKILSRKWAPGAAAALVAVVYLYGALAIASTRAIWSPDCGARLIQVESLLQHWPHWWVSFPGAALDPDHHHSPLTFYEFNHGGHIYIFYSFVFALVSAALFRCLGFLGLSLLPMLCGIGASIAAYGIARRLMFRYPAGPLLTAGLASPLVLYSIVFWDHSITTCIAAVCLYLCVLAADTQRPVFWFAAGAVFGGGLWIHEILIPYLPAMLIGACWVERPERRLRSAGMLLLGSAIFIAPLAVVNQCFYGTPLGPHLSNNRIGSAYGIVDQLVNFHLWGTGALYTFFAWGNSNPGFTWELWDWLKPTSSYYPVLSSELLTSFKLALPLLYWILLAFSGLWKRLWVASIILFAGLIAVSAFVLNNVDWPHGLFLATPVLSLAFAGIVTPVGEGNGSWLSRLPFLRKRMGSSGAGNGAAKEAPGEPEQTTAARLKGLVAIVTLMYTMGALLNPALGGTEYGSRYLLITIPALAVLSWSAVESLLPARTVASRVLLAGMAALAVVSVALQIHGFNITYGMHQYNRELTDAIEKTPDNVVLTNVWWPPLDAAPAYTKKQIFYIGDEAHSIQPLLKRMRAADVRTYSLLANGYWDSWTAFGGQSGYVPLANTSQNLPWNLGMMRYVVP